MTFFNLSCPELPWVDQKSIGESEKRRAKSEETPAAGKEETKILVSKPAGRADAPTATGSELLSPVTKLTVRTAWPAQYLIEDHGDHSRTFYGSYFCIASALPAFAAKK